MVWWCKRYGQCRSWTSYYYFMFVPTTNQFVISFWSCMLPKELSNVCNMVGLYYWTTRMVVIALCRISSFFVPQSQGCSQMTMKSLLGHGF